MPVFILWRWGPHLILQRQKQYVSNFGREVDYEKNNDVGFGINGIVGLEYRLPENIPLRSA